METPQQQQGSSPSDAILNDDLTDAEASTANHNPKPKASRLSRMKIGRGMYNDIRARLPFYVSDWTDAWTYRVIPATLVIFFANVLPGIAFSLDLIETTGQYGVQEVLLSTFMAAFIASIFGGQPLLISGVTGPITVFNKTIFDIFHSRIISGDLNYLHFIGWVYLWGAIFHWVAAVVNAVSLLKYVTRFPCETFGFYVAWIYLQYGVQVVTRQFTQSADASAFLGIVLAILTLITPFIFTSLSRTTLLHRHFRRFLSDYGMPITVVCVSALAYWGSFSPYTHETAMTLPTNPAYQPANGRAWLVKFWELGGKDIGVAMPFGLVLFILFYFDANVSSLMAQGSEFSLRKPPGFHWDFFLLGISTFIAGLLGVPAPNGLIPQAPMHTASLVIMAVNGKQDEEESLGEEMSPPTEEEVNGDRENRGERHEVAVGVVEQRVSNLAQGAFCLILMTGPFQHSLLGRIPKGVLAGLFWYMGSDALLGNPITGLFLYLIREKHFIDDSDPLNKVRRGRIWMWMILQLLGFAATFAITQTIAAIGFPVVITLLVPIRVWLIPRMGLFTPGEMSILDGPVASPFTMASVGGSI